VSVVLTAATDTTDVSTSAIVTAMLPQWCRNC
jgi:hypothetical protein